MNSRWLSTFTLIGALLLILGAVGLALQHTGSGFVFDPGQPPPAGGQDNTPWYYLVIGALMVLNGLLTPASETTDKTEKKGGGGPGGGATPSSKTTGTMNTDEPGASAPRIKPRTPGGREAVATSAEQTGD